MATTILIADDHVMVRQGLRILFEQSGFSVAAESDSGESTYLSWQTHRPDIVLLDIDMPGMGGLETLKRILAQDKHARIVIYSMYDDAMHVSRALQAGACAYVAKSDSPELLLEAISQVLRGKSVIGQQVAAKIAEQGYSRRRNPVDTLTAREFEIFRRLVIGESLREISSQLHIGYKSVANLQTRTRHKLGVQTTDQLVQIAVHFGIGT